MSAGRAALLLRLLCALLCAVLCAPLAAGSPLGLCPVYPMLDDFDINRMTGTWYEVERSFYFMEISASCTKLNVTINERGYLLITIKTINRWTGFPSTSYGVGIPSQNGSSWFRYKVNNRMPYLIGRLLPGAGQYYILSTDYTQFAILWSCTSVSVAHSDRMWVLGREREIAAELRARIYNLLQQFSLDPDRLLLAKNNNCSPEHIVQTIN